MEDVVLQYTYPRIDSEVTKHRNHLLKAPFCVHPSTGRVCVPVDPKRTDEFDPEKVPTVGQLLRELDSNAKEGAVESETPADDGYEHYQGNPDPYHTLSKLSSKRCSSTADWERTSLKPYVEILDAHARNLMGEVRRRRREQGMLFYFAVRTIRTNANCAFINTSNLEDSSHDF